MRESNPVCISSHGDGQRFPVSPYFADENAVETAPETNVAMAKQATRAPAPRARATKPGSTAMSDCISTAG